MDYFGDGSAISPVTGKTFGVHIEYYFEEQPLGNAGALFQIKDKLDSDFLLLNADAMFDVDFNRFVDFHKSHTRCRKAGLFRCAHGTGQYSPRPPAPESPPGWRPPLPC